MTPGVFYPSGNYIEVVVGTPLSISAYVITNSGFVSSSLAFRPTSGSPVTMPTYEISNDGVNITIVYERVGEPPTAEHELCFEMMSVEGTDPPDVCIGGFILNITGRIASFNNTLHQLTLPLSLSSSLVPELNISTDLVVREKSDFQAGQVYVTCTPADSMVPVLWSTIDNQFLWQENPAWQFTPSGLNHTVRMTVAPDQVTVIVCGLFNGPLSNGLLNPRQITVVPISREP